MPDPDTAPPAVARAVLDGGVLRIWRDDPTFAQRFSATLGDDRFQGRWQLARTPGD